MVSPPDTTYAHPVTVMPRLNTVTPLVVVTDTTEEVHADPQQRGHLQCPQGGGRERVRAERWTVRLGRHDGKPHGHDGTRGVTVNNLGLTVTGGVVSVDYGGTTVKDSGVMVSQST